MKKLMEIVSFWRKVLITPIQPVLSKGISDSNKEYVLVPDEGWDINHNLKTKKVKTVKRYKPYRKYCLVII